MKKIHLRKQNNNNNDKTTLKTVSESEKNKLALRHVSSSHKYFI